MKKRMLTIVLAAAALFVGSANLNMTAASGATIPPVCPPFCSR